MFSGGNFPVKIEIQKSVSEFASCYGMPDVGAGACVLPPPPARPAPAGTRRHRLAPAGTGSPAGRVGSTGHRPRPPAPAGHGLRTRQADPSRRGEAPARLRPELNKKAGNPEGKPAKESGQL